jgi:hypothetical protein
MVRTTPLIHTQSISPYFLRRAMSCGVLKARAGTAKATAPTNVVLAGLLFIFGVSFLNC